MLLAFISIIVAISVLFLFYACFGFGKSGQQLDNMQMAYALDELNPSDYNSYAVAPVRKNKRQ
ncbi:MAG: hypothetical protein KDD89_06325 [Anaerolineales bacterium]|nr:hypothetical protein [Anaerolineales bacterium]